MSDHTTDNPPVDETPELPATLPDSDAEPGAGSGDERGSNREAAKYRTRLREAEAQRDTLSGRLEAMQRAEAQRLASRHLVDGTDLWRGDGVDLAALLDEDGNLDPAAVAEHARAVAAKHPHWKRAVKRRRSVGELRSGAVSADYHRAPNWSDVLNDRKGDG